MRWIIIKYKQIRVDCIEYWGGEKIINIINWIWAKLIFGILKIIKLIKSKSKLINIISWILDHIPKTITLENSKFGRKTIQFKSREIEIANIYNWTRRYNQSIEIVYIRLS